MADQCVVLELEQAPVDPVVQQPISMPKSSLQPSYPPAGVIPQPIGSGVEVVLPLEPSIAPSGPPSVMGPPSVTEEPPTFRLGLQNQTVMTGDVAVFTVFYGGQPRPSVHWYIDGRSIDDTDHPGRAY